MKSISWQSIASKKFAKMVFTIAVVLFWTACSDSSQNISPSAGAGAKGKITKMDVPTLACAAGATQVSLFITVTGGINTGAPAGFTLQWQTAADFAANGWTNSATICDASFSGNAYDSRYNLAAGQSVTVSIGEFLFDNGASTSCGATALKCGTEYVFRTFAHATSTLNRSDFSGNTSCSTAACYVDLGCTYTQGYWKTHGSAGPASKTDSLGNYISVWPVASLTLGTVSYSAAQLQSIFNTPAAGNGLLTLAHQLIAAKLNIANGANGSTIADAIAAADALIGNLVIPPVGSASVKAGATSSLVTTLTTYNEGSATGGPGHCE